MEALSNADCLRLWEHGFRLHPLDRGLLALDAALPQTSHELLADWPLGSRNSALAELHRICFGPNLHGRLSCPRCSEDLEFGINVQELLKKGTYRESQPSSHGGEAGRASAPIVVDGRSFRLPTVRDLAVAAREGDAPSAAARLAESCRIDGAEPADWSDEDVERIGAAMAAADPMAEIRLTFNCAKCSLEWEESLDIVVFLWLEIEARAKRLLIEVHTLASAYGWTEREILSLSEPRRRLYLDMVRT